MIMRSISPVTSTIVTLVEVRAIPQVDELMNHGLSGPTQHRFPAPQLAAIDRYMLVSKTVLFYACLVGGPRRRRYDSPLRAAQAERARAVILAAATRLFTERGWNGTGMRDVARAANVSIETVYRNFSSKAELLKQAIDVSVVGDTQLVPLADRDDFRQMGKGSAAERCEAIAQLLATIWARGARLHRVLSQAAAGDPQLSELLADSLRNERESA